MTIPFVNKLLSFFGWVSSSRTAAVAKDRVSHEVAETVHETVNSARAARRKANRKKA
jgi:hypothetical protein